MGALKPAGNMLHFLITSLSKSKFSVISYVSCFLEIIHRFSFFVMYQSMVADRSSTYDEVIAYGSVFNSFCFVLTSVVVYFMG